MELTIELIKEGLEKQPELKESLLSVLADGRIIRTKEEDEQFLTSHVNSVVEERAAKLSKEKINEEYGNAMRTIDEKIKTITGIEKKPGEKTTDYAARAVEEKRQGGDPLTKERVAQLEAQLTEQETTYKTELEQTKSQLFNREIDWQLNAALDSANIAVPAHLKTDAEKQGYVAQQKALIKQGFLSGIKPKADETGAITFYEGEKPLLHVKDGKPKAAGELISEKFAAWFVPPAQSITGTGQNQQHRTETPGSFSNKESIHAHLAAKGLEAGSGEYLSEFKQLAQDSNISI